MKLLKILSVYICSNEKKNEEAYNKIFSYINNQIMDEIENTDFNLRSFTTDFEESLFNAFYNVFNNTLNNIHHIGCFFHYLQACRRKLQSNYLTKKIYKNIYEEFKDNNTTKDIKYKFDFDLYNDKSLFKYINQIYLIYNKNCCWLDCFIILYIFIFNT